MTLTKTQRLFRRIYETVYPHTRQEREQYEAAETAAGRIPQDLPARWHPTPRGWTESTFTGQWRQLSDGTIRFDPRAGRKRPSGRLLGPPQRIEPGTFVKGQAHVVAKGPESLARVSLAFYDPLTGRRQAGVSGHSINGEGTAQIIAKVRAGAVGLILVADTNGSSTASYTDPTLAPL